MLYISCRRERFAPARACAVSLAIDGIPSQQLAGATEEEKESGDGEREKWGGGTDERAKARSSGIRKKQVGSEK